MGFYFDPGNQDDEEPEGTLKEAIAMTFVVFRVLALPLGIMFGAIAALVVIFILFSTHVYLGFGALGLIVLAIVARGFWEWRHPPKLQ